MPYSDYQMDLEEFCGYFREMVENRSDDEALIAYVYAAMRGEADGPQLRMIAEHIAYLEERQRYEEAIANLQEQKEQYENYKDKLEMEFAEYRADLDEQYEERIMYDLAEEKFVSNEAFRHKILEQIRSDIQESRSKNEPSKLFLLSLKHCDKQELKAYLVNECKDELLDHYKSELMPILMELLRTQVGEELKGKLRNDPKLTQEMKREVMQELAGKLFE